MDRGHSELLRTGIRGDHLVEVLRQLRAGLTAASADIPDPSILSSPLGDEPMKSGRIDRSKPGVPIGQAREVVGERGVIAPLGALIHLHLAQSA